MRPKPLQAPRQQTDRLFTQNKCNKRRSEKITALITEMIAVDMHPLSTVGDVGFNILMAYLEPSRTARVEKLYNDYSASTKRKLSNSNSPYMALTTDCWTSMNTLS